MTIEKLNSTASLIASLRTDSKITASGVRQKPVNAAETSEKAPASGNIKILREELVNLVKDVDVNDAVAVKLVTPKVIRSILLWQYGPEIREHPEWSPILEAISKSIETHKTSQENFLKLLSELKS